MDFDGVGSWSGALTIDKTSWCTPDYNWHRGIEYIRSQPQFLKGLTLVQALRSRVGAKGSWRIFFENPTTQLRVVWGLTEKKCEQTPKFACFSV